MRGGWPLIVSAQYRRSWELLYLLTARDLKLRYQDTVLGFVWSVLKPLLLGLVLYVVLKHVIRVHTNAPYQLVLLTALFPWTWFQTSAMMAAPAIANNGNLIKKVHFPRYVLPFATVTNNLVHFLLTLPIITIFILASGRHPSWSWIIGIPILTALELALLLGTVLIVSSIDVFFRDLEHLLEVFLNLMFYGTPIIYELGAAGHYRNVFLINPLTSLIEGWRNLFIYNHIPTPVDLWPCIAFTVVVLIAGSFIFGRLEGSFADAL